MRPSHLLKTSDPMSQPDHKHDIQDAPEIPAGLATCATCDLYALLLETPHTPAVKHASRQLLMEQLEQAGRQCHDVPANPRDLESWMERRALETGSHYAEY